MYSYSFHIFRLNNLKVIHNLHSQYLTEILSETTFAQLISNQPAVLFSQNEAATSNQPQPASSTLLSQQTSTSHQAPANRTGC
jgi:hypothetical protein